MNRLLPLVLLALISAAQAQPAPTGNSASATTADAKTTAQAGAAQKPASDSSTDPNDPLFGVPPLPNTPVSLVGGRVDKIDRIHNRVNVRIFGGGAMNFRFNERTHIYRDGVETTERGIQKGDRVYVDTQLNSGQLFARNIRVVTNAAPADARGQIIDFDRRSGTMTVRDDLSARNVTFTINQNTQITAGGQRSAAGLQPGSLVAVLFSPDGRHNVARQVNLLATPGNRYLFQGKVTYLDLRSGIIAVSNDTDKKTYDLHFDPRTTNVGDVTVGSEVTVNAVFEPSGYRAQDIHVAAAQTSEKQ